MKTMFDEFITKNPSCKKYEVNKEAKEIFETILSADTNVIAMVEMAQSGKPALVACILEVEAYYNHSATKEFDLKDNFTKQALGRMVKSILEPFGYEVIGQKDMPRATNTQYVTSASTYKLTGIPKLKIVKTIIECYRVGGR